MNLNRAEGVRRFGVRRQIPQLRDG